MIKSSSPKKQKELGIKKVVSVSNENFDNRTFLLAALTEQPTKKLLKLRKIDLKSEEYDKAKLFERYDKERKLREINEAIKSGKEFIDGPIKHNFVPEVKIVHFKDEVYRRIV